jgi:hypothetical protein
MCIVCRDWQLGKLTYQEAQKNLREMFDAGYDSDEEKQHFLEVFEEITEDKFENGQD